MVASKLHAMMRHLLSYTKVMSTTISTQVRDKQIELVIIKVKLLYEKLKLVAC